MIQMNRIVLIALFISAAIALTAQESSNGHFLVEFDKFSPPTRDLVTSFEGHIAEPFLATDLQGTEHFLGSYKGKKVLLWFWSVVIPNGEIFGQMAYGADLGSPRMFLIDEFGIIKIVLPAEAFVDNTKLLISLESMLGGF